jgi:MFS family permease
MGALVTNVAISNWFVRKRGRALSIARVGNNLSNVIFVPVVVFIIANHGWRNVFLVFAIFTWLTVIIPSTLLMRRRPEDLGLLPDGDLPDRNAQDPVDQDQAGAGVAPSSEPVWTRRQVLATASFWLLALCMGIDSMALQGLNITLAPYIQDLGYSDTSLAAIMTFRAVAMAAAFPVVAFIAERSQKTLWRVLPFVVQGTAAFLFLFAGEPVLLWVAVILYGLGIAALTVIIEVVWAEYFGRVSLGLVRSLAFLAAFGFGAAGPLVMSAIFDLTQSYHLAFLLLGVLFGVAAVLMGILRPPRRSGRGWLPVGSI